MGAESLTLNDALNHLVQVNQRISSVKLLSLSALAMLSLPTRGLLLKHARV